MDAVKGGPRAKVAEPWWGPDGDPEIRAYVLRQELAANYASGGTPERAVELTRTRYASHFGRNIDDLREKELQRRAQPGAKALGAGWSVDRKIWWDVMRGRIPSLPVSSLN